MDSLEPSAELARRPRTMLKILFFSEGHHFFQVPPAIKFIYERGRKYIYLLTWEAYFETGETVSANL